jgi:formamidopyrimidine-DNA glycosylase
MPELPEVETVARDLQRWVAGATILDAEVRWERTIRHPQPPERFAAELRGATIARVGRRAKSVLLHLADGRVMTVALRMTGALIVAPQGAADDRYARVVFRLADGRELRYRDVRKFGRIGLWEGGGAPRRRPGRARQVAEAGAPYRVGQVFARHGPEPLAHSFSAARLAERLRGRSARLKTLLLDQSFIAGVGNIYADEALWRARLHPLRAADTLTPVEVRRLHRAVRAVLRQGIANRGASFADYVGADGEPGDNAERLAVYQRTGQPCLRCGRPISRIVVGQRSTHFCPRCQQLPGEEAGE